MKSDFRATEAVAVCLLLAGTCVVCYAEDWPQLKFDSRHSGNVPDRTLGPSLGFIGAVPLTDAIFTAPVVANTRVFVIDGSGVVFCIDAATLQVLWKYETAGGKVNCNNVSSPAVVDRYLHVGTMAGTYYVLDVSSGTAVKQIACGEPIFCSPVVANGRAYFATLGSKVYALEPNGTICWTWDFVVEKTGFRGDRWSGRDWALYKKSRVTPDDLFCCSTDIVARGKTIILPAGGSVVWLEDSGDRTSVQATATPRNTTLGLSIGEDGAVYRQWTLLDNGGRVDILRLGDGGKVISGAVEGTRTSTAGGLLSFCSVSLRGTDVYRCRPEEDFGLCRHTTGRTEPQSLSPHPALAAPILLRDDAGLCLMDGTLYYSCYFGYSAKNKRDMPSAKGLTAAIKPDTGQVIWLTTQRFIHGGCTISAENGRLYLGGYNKLEQGNSFVWCIDARDGSMIWKSDPVREAIQVVTIGPRFLFVHAQYQNGFLLDKATGKILHTLTQGYKCTRFTLSEPYLLGSNMDLYDPSNTNDVKLVSTGPRLDPSECVGAVVSNGRIFHTCHAGGLQVCQAWGLEAEQQ